MEEDEDLEDEDDEDDEEVNKLLMDAVKKGNASKVNQLKQQDVKNRKNSYENLEAKDDKPKEIKNKQSPIQKPKTNSFDKSNNTILKDIKELVHKERKLSKEEIENKGIIEIKSEKSKYYHITFRY